MRNLLTQKVFDEGDVFDDHFFDIRRLYLFYFKKFPSLSFINHIDGKKAFGIFKEKFSDNIRQVYNSDYYYKKKYEFSLGIMVFKNEVVIEFTNSSCEIAHAGNQDQLIAELTAVLAPLKEKQRRDPLEINLIIQGRSRLELKPMEIKRTKLDVDLFYEDEFKEVDELIRKRLNQKKDKGIVLLHGLPGTGKTTYLRYLIGKIKKRVLFLSPSVADDLMNPSLVELLISNPNTVLVIEDAENVIKDRKYNSSSSVSNLLNISDGLLADFLNVQLICTFNSSLTMIDSALTRKGRLIAKYEFGKLNTDKAQKLSDHLGFKQSITEPMTVAEIANPHEKQQQAEKVEVIGFKRQGVLLN
jgi:hypothetical protein